MELKPGERIDYVNDNLSLIQNTEGLTFGTDALLLAGYMSTGLGTSLELGAGTGIISMLALTRNKAKNVTALEVQEEYAELIKRNAELNGLSDRLTSLSADLRSFSASGEYDCVFTNPPYMKADGGRSNLSDKKNIARHEVRGGIYDFLECAGRALRFGGAFFAVYRQDRLADLMDAMRRSSVEPKRMTFVHADTKALPSMVLVEGRRGGKCGLKITRPLFIYTDRSHLEYSDDMKYIMENGSFDEEFYIKNG